MSDQAPLSKRIAPIFGPYAGSQIDIPAADAEQAIADGWARDPFAPPSTEPAPEYDAEKHAKAVAAAEKAARKLRGEPEPGETETASEKPAEAEAAKPKGMPKAKEEETEAEAETGTEVEDRSIEAEAGGAGYQTRESTAARRGRPPKK